MSLFSRIKNLFDVNSLPLQKPEVSQDKVEAIQPAIQPDEPKQENPIAAIGNAKQVIAWEIGDNILDTFTILDIKSGGMGRVYIAENRNRKQIVAIKAPNEKMLSDKTLFARVVREAQQWIDLGLHPNIAYCYYVRQINEIPHIFIEYIDGGNLRDWISAEHCQELKLGLDIAIQFCHGMEYAQQYGMVHRDIKPENILMTANGTLKITDFGLARMIGGAEEVGVNAGIGVSQQQEQLTMIGQKGVGTAAYMSPEQYLDLRSVDTRADIYSFGVCLYEMFCGCRPFEYETREVPPSILAKYQGHRPADPRIKRRDIPEKLAALLERCCALAKEHRYHSFYELRQELVTIYRGLYRMAPPHAETALTNLKADGLNNRGVSYWDLGQEDDASRCWDEALRSDPQHLAATFNLAYMQWHKAKLGSGEILARLRNLESLHGINPDFWRCLAWVLYEQGYVEEINSLQQSPHAIRDKDFLRALTDGNRPIGRKVRQFIGHTQSVKSVAFSPDGRHVLTGSFDCTARLWDVESGQEVQRFNGHKDKIYSVKFSPDNRYVLTGSDDCTARLWEIKSGREYRRFNGHEKWVSSVDLSHDGQYVLTGSGDNTARLWEIKSGLEMRKFEGREKWITSVSFSPDDRLALIGSGSDSILGENGFGQENIDATARILEIASGREIRRFESNTPCVTSVCFSSDNRYVLTGTASDENKIYNAASLWDVKSGQKIQKFTGHPESVLAVSMSIDCRYVLTGSWDNTARLWDTTNGSELRKFEGHTLQVFSVCFSPDGQYVLTGSGDNTAQLWECRYGRRQINLRLFPLPAGMRDSAGLVQDNADANNLMRAAEQAVEENDWRTVNRLAQKVRDVPGFERDEGALELLSLSGNKGAGWRQSLRGAWQVQRFVGHTKEITSVCFSPDGRYVLTGSCDNTVRLWDAANGQEVLQIPGFMDFFLEISVCISPNGRYVLVGSDGNTARLWEIETGLEIQRFEGHTEAVNSVCFSPDGRYVLTGSGSASGKNKTDNTARIWDIETGREIRQFKGHGDFVTSVSFSRDGRKVLTGSSDNTARVWDVKTGRELQRIEGHIGGITSACFSADGKYLLTCSWDKTARMWGTESGRELRRFEGTTETVTSVSFSLDGRYVLTGSWEHAARLWEAKSGQEVRRFEGHTGGINAVSFSPDSRYVLTGSSDNSALLWEIDWEWEFSEENINS